jgi:hypothetical protein
MRKAIDVASNAGPSANTIRRNGIDIVVRYYTKYSGGKCVKRDEAVCLANAGLQVGVIYQDYNNTIDRFSGAEGSQQASAALNLASNLIRQPRGSAIYFSVDFDPDNSELTTAIIPYFEAIGEQFARAGSPYQIGAYGSGLTLQTLLDKNLIQYAWLSLSTGFRGSKQFKASGRWHILQTKEVGNWFGLNVDLDDINDAFPNVGEFVPDALPPGAPPAGAPASQASIPYTVIARDGLHLRSGPGVEFNSLRILTSGTTVFVLAKKGDWMLVDLEGNGEADGYVFGGYLQIAG